MTVTLTEAEWNQVVGILAQAPWNVANPLLNRIAEQLRGQKGATAAAVALEGARDPGGGTGKPAQGVFPGPGNRHG